MPEIDEQQAHPLAEKIREHNDLCRREQEALIAHQRERADALFGRNHQQGTRDGGL
jgi:hypothetical protein